MGGQLNYKHDSLSFPIEEDAGAIAGSHLLLYGKGLVDTPHAGLGQDEGTGEVQGGGLHDPHIEQGFDRGHCETKCCGQSAQKLGDLGPLALGQLDMAQLQSLCPGLCIPTWIPEISVNTWGT